MLQLIVYEMLIFTFARNADSLIFQNAGNFVSKMLLSVIAAEVSPGSACCKTVRWEMVSYSSKLDASQWHSVSWQAEAQMARLLEMLPRRAVRTWMDGVVRHRSRPRHMEVSGRSICDEKLKSGLRVRSAGLQAAPRPQGRRGCLEWSLRRRLPSQLV